MNKNIIFVIVLAILVLVSLVQAVQLTTLKAKVDAGAVKIAGTSATPQAGGSPAAGGIDNLPTMVGGC